MLRGICRTIGRALELRGLEPLGHTQRVALLAQNVAIELGLNSESVQAVYLGGLIHDIGKLWLPEHLSSETGLLEPAERALVQQHTVYGEALAQEISGIHPLSLALIRNHHERFDGKGYPDGLQGENIPWVARIFRVVDSYFTLTTDWWHRQACDPLVALSEIQSLVGSHYDPQVVAALLKVLGSPNLPTHESIDPDRGQAQPKTVNPPPAPLFAVLDQRYRLLYAPSGVMRRFALRVGEALPKRLTRSDARRLLRLRNSLGGGRRPRPIEVGLKGRPEHFLSIEPTFVPVDEDVGMWFVWIRDRSIEKRLMERVALMGQALQSSSAATLITDSQQRIVEANQAFVQQSGYGLSEVVGRTPWMLQSPQANPQQQAVLRQSLEQKQSARVELLHCRKGGEGFWAQVILDPVTDVGGHLTHWIWVLDETATLAQVRQEAERLMQVSQDMVCVSNSEGRFISVNPACEAVLGYTAQELLGQRLQDLVQGNPLPLRGLRNSVQPTSIELLTTTKSGESKWIAWNVTSFDNEDRAYWVGRDVTEQRRAEESLAYLLDSSLNAQESERERIALDLHDGPAQTLVSAMRFLESLEGQLSPELLQNLQRGTRLIAEAVRQIRNTITHLVPPDLDVLGLKLAIQQLLDRVAREEGWEVNAALRNVNLPYDIQVVFYRVFAEALQNVRKHARTKRLGVVLERIDSEVLLEVRDWGVGFAPQQFFADQRPRASVGLLGIRRRAELAGCQCEIRSQPGRGTLIRLRYQDKAIYE